MTVKWSAGSAVRRYPLPVPYLLLRQAVQRAQSPHEVNTVYAHHLVLRHQLGQRGECNPIVRIVERGHYHHTVRDVEVRVARRQALAIHHYGARIGERFNSQAMLACSKLETAEVVCRTSVVLVCGIRFVRKYDGARINETRDVVHVAVGVVSNTPLAQPDGVAHAE